MLIKSDKPPSQPTSYRPISLLSAIMKLFEWVIDAGQWARSKNIDLAVEYLQKDVDKLTRWCAKWRIKLNPEKIKVIIFSRSQTAVRAEPALSIYGDLLSYYPHIKFLGITFDNRMTFTRHFKEILECCSHKFHHLKILVNKKWGPSPTTILQIYKQCKRPIFEYGIVSTITVSESVITNQNTKSPELFY